MKGFAAFVVIALAGGALLYWVSTSQAAAECEACVEWNGRRVCGRVAAETREEATRRAVSHACGIATTGVTDTLACEKLPPVGLACRVR